MIIFEDGTNISLKENERIIDVVGDNYLSELDNSTTDNKIISNYQLIENKFELVSSKQSSSIVSYNFLSNGNIIYSDLFETYGSTIVMSNFKFEKLYSFSAPQGFTSFVYTELSNLAILFITYENLETHRLILVEKTSGLELGNYEIKDIKGLPNKIVANNSYLAFFVNGSLTCIDFRGETIWKEEINKGSNLFQLSDDSNLFAMYISDSLKLFDYFSGRIFTGFKLHEEMNQWSNISFYTNYKYWEKTIKIYPLSDFDFIVFQGVWSYEEESSRFNWTYFNYIQFNHNGSLIKKEEFLMPSSNVNIYNSNQLHLVFTNNFCITNDK